MASTSPAPVLRYLLAALLTFLLIQCPSSAVDALPLPTDDLLANGVRAPTTAFTPDNAQIISTIESRNPSTCYKDSVKKGKNLWKTIRNPTAKLAQAANWAYEDLIAWGWSEIGGPAAQNVPAFQDKTGGLEEPLEVLGIGPENCWSVLSKHNVDTKHNGLTYPATEASYFSFYSPAKGAIMVFDRHSPEYFRTRGNPSQLKGQKMPLLLHWSDLTFLTWMKYFAQTSAAQRTPLQYMFVRGITNTKTQEIVSDALARLGHKGGLTPPKWPGYKLMAPSGSQTEKAHEPFLAVLGTENFGGIAYLLAQHVRELGPKEIEYIQVWGDGGRSEVVHAMVRFCDRRA